MTMKTATLLIATALACSALGAQAAPPPAQVDPAAVAALARMSAYLRTIPAFQITLRTQRDDVDVYGQVITLGGGAIYKVRRPDAFFIDLSLTSAAAQYVYDGKMMTVYDARSTAYTKFPASLDDPRHAGAGRRAVRGHGASGRPLHPERRQCPGKGADLGALHRQVPDRRPDHEPLRLPPARAGIADLDRRRGRAGCCCASASSPATTRPGRTPRPTYRGTTASEVLGEHVRLCAAAERARCRCPSGQLRGMP